MLICTYPASAASSLKNYRFCLGDCTALNFFPSPTRSGEIRDDSLDGHSSDSQNGEETIFDYHLIIFSIPGPISPCVVHFQLRSAKGVRNTNTVIRD